MPSIPQGSPVTDLHSNLGPGHVADPLILCSPLALSDFYGGAQQGTVLNGNFELYLTPPSPNKTEEENRNRNTMKDLHIADASVIPALTPGGPTATVMEMGMLVAKRVCGETLPLAVAHPLVRS